MRAVPHVFPVPMTDDGSEPGAGAASAMAAMLAADALRVAARVSAPEWDEAHGIAAQAEALGERLGALAAENAEAYARARAALEGHLPPGTQHERDLALGRILEHAAVVPTRVGECAADVVVLAQAVEAGGAPRVRPDARAAAVLAAGAAEAASILVEANLVGHGDGLAARARAASARAGAVAATLRSGPQ